MFAALTLTMAIAAPVPAPTAPVPVGVAPRVMELKANADGKVMVVVTRTEKVQIGAGAAIAPPGGGAIPAPAIITREVPVSKSIELGEVKDLTIMTADGKKLTTEEATKKIADGAIVVISGDGKAVSPAFLKVFKDDTLVLAAPELVPHAGGGIMFPGGRTGPGVRPLPLPVNPGGAIQIQPGVIQIQIAPGGALPVVPAQPVVPAKPAETKPAEKPPVGQ